MQGGGSASSVQDTGLYTGTTTIYHCLGQRVGGTHQEGEGEEVLHGLRKAVVVEHQLQQVGPAKNSNRTRIGRAQWRNLGQRYRGLEASWCA